MPQIHDGTGTGYSVKIDKQNRMATRATTINYELEQSLNERGFNINTGDITITQKTAVFFYEHGEDADLVIPFFAFAAQNGDYSKMSKITVKFKCTQGTIVDNAIAPDIHVNRSVSANKESLSNSRVFQGVDGDTLTNGVRALYFYHGTGRMGAAINVILKKGDSIGIEVEPFLNSGNMECYAAIVCNLAEEND